MLRTTKPTVRRARELRRALTLPELILWRHLRSRPGGHKFRRQHPAGPYVLDFYCDHAGLALEVDGAAHDMGDNPRRDALRDRWLADRGIRTFRIPAREVLADPEAVVTAIVEACGGSTPPPLACGERSPSPPGRS